MHSCSSQQAQHRAQRCWTASEGPEEGNCLALGHVQFLAERDSNSQLTLLASDLECIPTPVPPLQKMASTECYGERR